MPYPASVQNKTDSQYVVRMKLNPDTSKIEAFEKSLAEKISEVFLTGKYQTSKRKKRATSSVLTTVSQHGQIFGNKK